MKVGIVTIQRNRARYLVEWFAFHYAVGFRKFYYYAHMCNDATHDILRFLSRKLDITTFVLKDKINHIQLMAYQHACDNFMDDVDWMAFIDGDEFLFPTSDNDISSALSTYQQLPVSAVAAFNVNFGSNGHIQDPDGLIIENYTRCSRPDFMPNRRVKSLVKGKQKISTSMCSNIFNAPLGTVDEHLRPITWGYMPDYEPSYNKLRFNHYVCQSREFYESFKRLSGHADAGLDNVRGEDWWQKFDTNEVEDHTISRFIPETKRVIEWIYT